MLLGCLPLALTRHAEVELCSCAATAVHHQVTVLHYDSDYDHIRDAYSQLSTRWVVARGSID